ncbi:UNVERIFIED_CONTAM: hypothetical protein GTU68_053531 [Idotea baltica]|nr:hypothetical protein [Idotea baltica]
MWSGKVARVKLLLLSKDSLQMRMHSPTYAKS